MKFWLLVSFISFSWLLNAQNTDCKLMIGTNLSGLSDWMTEMPFVDMMHHARTWGTRNRTWLGGNSTNQWNTELMSSIETDEQGYPLELPFYQEGLGLEDSQMVFTVWANIDAWEPGNYTLLYDGEGWIDFRMDGKVINREQGKLSVEIIPSDDSFLEMVIRESRKGNHIRNIRLLMPGHEDTFAEQAFNPLYLERLQNFATLRFMDWGQTNNWGEDASWLCYDEPNDTILKTWNERSKPDFYTWSHNKGVPYETMCDLCNALNKDMWICVPHNASNEYITEMAGLIKKRLNPELKIYAEYSNEIWNWMFGQTQWLNTFFCINRGISWPEGIVDRVQNNLDIWTEVFADEPNRVIKVAGGQTAWQDVTNRIVKNLAPNSFDALNITAYFGLGDDTALDALGTKASAADIAAQVRKNMHELGITAIKNQYQLAKELKIPIVFYEAGQHITPTPFGEEPSYAQALLAIQRDTALYHLYHEWFTLIENVLDEGDQAPYMNFSFVGDRSARYGSWGILETLNQDTSQIYAPKFQATMEQILYCGQPGNSADAVIKYNNSETISIIKGPDKSFTVKCTQPLDALRIYSSNGDVLKQFNLSGKTEFQLNLVELAQGIYLIKTEGPQFQNIQKIQIN
ncbi:MAG: hypothetical protein ACERKD_01230 [Prolixibacteraceae bacterium]